jgi:hypothetical protein
MKPNYFLFFLLFPSFFLFGMNSLHARYDDPERLSVTIKARVEWDETTKNTNDQPMYRTFGSYVINIDGFLKFNEKNSPVVNRGGIMVMPVETYDCDVLTVSMSYEEEWHDLDPDSDCSESLTLRFHGNTTQRITIGPVLIINNFSSAMEPFLSQLSGQAREMYERTPGLQSIMPDYYQFSVGGGNVMETSPQEVIVKGVSRKADCTYEETEKRFPGFTIGLQMQLSESGTMTGRESWQADCDGSFPPGFGVKVSDITVHGGEKPYSPPRKSGGNATYSLEWDFKN